MSTLLKNQRAIMQRIIEEADIDKLLQIVTKMDDLTRAEVIKAISESLDITKKNFHLASIRRIIKASDDEIKDWIVTAVVQSYAEGSNLAYADLKTLSANPITGEVAAGAWTASKIRQISLFSVQKDAVNALISDAYLDFGNGMNGMVKGAEHILNEALKRQVRAQMIAGQITGTSMREIAREVRTIFEGQGFSVLIDRGGHSWSMKAYSQMLARTHIIKSANEGIIARALANDIDIVQVSQHPDSCKICKPFENEIYSLSGKSDEYEKLVEQPPFHPNCKHRLLMRPDLSRGMNALTNPDDDV